MNKDGILVAEYWTELPPKAELQARIQEAYRDAQERMARRELDTTDEGSRRTADPDGGKVEE